MNQRTILSLAPNPEAMPRLVVDDEARGIRIALRQNHRGDARHAAVVAGASTAIAGDAAGGVWFLEMTPSTASPAPQIRQPSASSQRRWRHGPRS
jgi:hypothetical protein